MYVRYIKRYKSLPDGTYAGGFGLLQFRPQTLVSVFPGSRWVPHIKEFNQRIQIEQLSHEL